ncbi:MAG TPA: hypothetical protein VHC69_17470 [Polyangiaceae bacterium]|nr:hypothetical protein [Polyangiaceae bacterium]
MGPFSQLNVLLDDGGSIAFGCFDERVIYARMSGGLSASLEATFIAGLQSIVDRTDALYYFSDASALDRYELRARNEFVKFVLGHRSKFKSLVMLTWSEGVSAASRAVAAVIGDAVEIVTDTKEFHSRLLQLAPSAARAIQSGTATAKHGAPARQSEAIRAQLEHASLQRR